MEKSSGSRSETPDRFTKAYDQLVALGLPLRLVVLYGRIVYHAGENGLCYTKWATLAKEIGLKDTKDNTTVYRLLCQLKALKLVEWKRHGRYVNEYRPLAPDIAWLQCQTLQGRNVSDIARTQCRKEYIRSLKEKQEKKHTPVERKATSLCASDDARADVASAPAKMPRADGCRPEWFDQWWAIYWRKVARKPAQKAFQAHVKTPERFAEVMAATRAQTPTMMARDPEKRPHGATWLNAERWNDEPSTPATARKPPERQMSLIERTEALIAKRLAKGERPV
jgi:hypothetical protein